MSAAAENKLSPCYTLISMLFMGDFDLTRMLLLILAFVAAIAVHEANHALVATLLGDDTPRRHGRLSLNPLRHIDPMGLLVFVLAGIGWGWTPVNPRNLRPNPRIGNAIVAAAGPLANLVLAVLLSLPLRAELAMPLLLQQFLFVAAALNLLLFVFNLIPIPPLDGFTVLLGLLPAHLARVVQQLERVGPGLILAFLFLPSFFHVNVVRMIYSPVARVFGFPGL